MDTKHDLLFGLLAYQKGAIDADCLAETCAESAKDRTLPLADQLVDRELLTVDQRTQLENAVREELEAHGGDVQATIAANLDGRSLNVLRSGSAGSAPIMDGQTAAYEPSGPVLIGSLSPEDSESRERYTLTNLYAKGGMGQVWLAHDPALGREIALKELRPDQAENPSVCSRFLTEARVTAQLEHPGIVPVYELGDQKLPYYTMRFVRGGTLSQTARNYHKNRVAGSADQLGMIKLLSAFVSICHAMAYAHSKGFIHRDLKGQNVVLGDFGEVIVLDWGLAKRIAVGPADAPHAPHDELDDQPDAADQDVSEQTLAPDSNGHSNGQPLAAVDPSASPELTIRGQILGTPAFMAPEQAEGRQHQTDFRTDVYGLGAILYELLTGQPPFHARTASELLRKVRTKPPDPPRQINPTADPALEAICLKALAKAPEDRYPTALDLARDVQRFLADEPVEAWREPWTRRAIRWARKHRTGVAAAAGLLITSTIALGVSTVLVSRERNEATLQGEQARAAVNDMYVDVAENLLENQLDPLQKNYLAKALSYYENFTSRHAGTRDVKLEHGTAYQRMAEIYRKFGQFGEAEQAFDRSLAILEPLAKASPTDTRVRNVLATTRTRMGDFLFRNNQLDRADLLFRQAAESLETSATQDPQSVEDRWLLARTLRSQGELMRRRNDLNAARQRVTRACELLEQAHASNPELPELCNDLAQANDFLGKIARDQGESALYEKAYQRAFEVLDPLIAAYPTIPRYRETMLHVCNGLGQYKRSTGDITDCESYWRRQLKEAERLAEDFPARTDFRRLLAGALSNVGGILAEQDKFVDAEPILTRGISINSALLKSNPEDQEVMFDLGNCHYNLGYLQFKRERHDEALASLDLARSLEEQALAAQPAPQPRYQRMLAMILRYRGEVLDKQGKESAIEAYRESSGILETLASSFPENAWYQIELAQCLNRLADKLVESKHLDDADARYQQALAALESRPMADLPHAGKLEKAMTLSNYGLFRHDTGRPGAEPLLNQSITIASELASATPPASADRRFLALARSNLGEVLSELGRYPEALASFDASIGEFKEVVRNAPTLVESRSYLGNAYFQQGQTLLKTDRQKDAKLAFEEATNQLKEVLKQSGGRNGLGRTLLAGALSSLADVSLALGDYNNTRNTAVELARAYPESPGLKLKAAHLLADCVLKLEKDGRVSSGYKEELTRDCLGRTVLTLQQVVDLDDKLTGAIHQDPTFKQLLDRPGFRTMFETLVNQ